MFTRYLILEGALPLGGASTGATVSGGFFITDASDYLLTGTTAAVDTSPWISWGPFRASGLVTQAVFSASSAGQRVRLRGTLTTASTKGMVAFSVINSSGTGVQAYAGSSGVFGSVQVYSTALGNGNTVRLVWGLCE